MERQGPKLWGCLCCAVTCACYVVLCWNHNLHKYVRDRFLHDLLPGVDHCHQFEWAVVHAFRVDTFTQEGLWVVGGCLLRLTPPPPPWEGTSVFGEVRSWRDVMSAGLMSGILHRKEIVFG